jgi:putative oxidoreductase
MLLFVWSGWGKLSHYSDTVAFMGSEGAPLPAIAAAIAVFMELFVGVILLVGFYTRPLAFIFIFFVLGTAVIGHHYWNMTGAARAGNMIQFYKNVSIMGGLLLLSVSGAGKYSIDRR